MDDNSAFDFVKEMLKGDNTYAINFDRIQWDNSIDKYVIVEIYFVLKNNSLGILHHILVTQIVILIKIQ